MGTPEIVREIVRAIVRVKKGNREINFYRHYDGDMTREELKEMLSAMDEWNAFDIVSELNGNRRYSIQKDLEGIIVDYDYEINCDQRTMKVSKIDYERFRE